jgi:predicted acylesterase/phospholipase RssA
MTTVEDKKRRPLLVVSAKEKLTSTQLRGASFELCYVENLVAAHAFASAALPSVLPPIKLNLETHQVRLVDGGIADNLPVDPAVRLGADKTVLIDISGKRWWFDREGKPHYSRDKWELESEAGTYCLRPTDTVEIRNVKAFGPILKEAVGRSRRSYIRSLGPTWPIFKLLSKKLGDEIAYEVMSYVVVNGDYIRALIALGYEEGKAALSVQGVAAER